MEQAELQVAKPLLLAVIRLAFGGIYAEMSFNRDRIHQAVLWQGDFVLGVEAVGNVRA